MADTEYRRLIQAAKDTALAGFLALVQRAVHDADNILVDQLTGAKPGVSQSELVALRYFLKQGSNAFLRRIDVLYRSSLERAIQTMYTDLRPGMRVLSTNEWSLIDDEAVNQQIEVGRLAQRMRDSNEESIGRLNVIIANLHGKSEVRERENPFRPYLLARALFESIRETIGDEHKEKALFELLADALVPHLSSHYLGIRDVFEAAGVRGKFIAQRSRAAHRQGYFGVPQDGAQNVALIGTPVVPDLSGMIDILQSAPAFQGGGNGREPASIQEFVRTMFGAAHVGRVPQKAANPLVAQLGEYQKKAALEGEVERTQAAEASQISTVRDSLDLEKASAMERMTVDVIAMLFEFMHEDEQIPAALRQHIAGLQAPTLKAALLEPALLNDEGHPARRLLNRMNSAAFGADLATPEGKRLASEMERIANQVLTEFKSDTAVFAKGLQEFDSYLSNCMRDEDKRASGAIDAVEAAETYSALLTSTTLSLCQVLLPLDIDKNISDFLTAVWPEVLVRAAWQGEESASDGLFVEYHAVLPELIWSLRDVKNPQERSVLLRLLPDLVRRLRSGMQLVQVPEQESKAMLDILAELHTRILRGGGKGRRRDLPTLDALRQHFERLAIDWRQVSWTLGEPPQARQAVIEEVFRHLGLMADLRLEGRPASAADRAFLGQSYMLGTRVGMRRSGGGDTQAKLVWVSTLRSLYLFRCDDGGLILYTPAALLDALADQVVVPLEYAPVFDRAVESLMFRLDQIEGAKAGSMLT
jgi:hypothetical protein